MSRAYTGRGNRDDHLPKLSGDSTLADLTAGRISPTVGTDGSAVPCVTFAMTNTATSLCIDGASSLEQHTLVVGTRTTTATEVNDSLEAMRAVASTPSGPSDRVLSGG